MGWEYPLKQLNRVRKKDNDRVFALKIVMKNIVPQPGSSLREQVKNATMMDSRFILRLKFFLETPLFFYFINDFQFGKDFFHQLANQGAENELCTRFYTAELILAVEYLHQHGVRHCGLREQDFLMSAHGHLIVRNFGFGSSRPGSPWDNQSYAAPELLDPETSIEKADCWSIGAFLFELHFGNVNFDPRITTLIDEVCFQSDINIKSLLEGLLQPDLERRLDTSLMKEHNFFRDVDWSEIAQGRSPPPITPRISRKYRQSNVVENPSHKGIIERPIITSSQAVRWTVPSADFLSVSRRASADPLSKDHSVSERTNRIYSQPSETALVAENWARASSGELEWSNQEQDIQRFSSSTYQTARSTVSSAAFVSIFQRTSNGLPSS
ncbi:MAG: hypothetical protein M1833_003212 [Piccolia ochrophora]|nr:MAG: hypothetical protein M1833_003212 [Piccolia ochrophora]